MDSNRVGLQIRWANVSERRTLVFFILSDASLNPAVRAGIPYWGDERRISSDLRASGPSPQGPIGKITRGPKAPSPERSLNVRVMLFADRAEWDASAVSALAPPGTGANRIECGCPVRFRRTSSSSGRGLWRIYLTIARLWPVPISAPFARPADSTWSRLDGKAALAFAQAWDRLSWVASNRKRHYARNTPEPNPGRGIANASTGCNTAAVKNLSGSPAMRCISPPIRSSWLALLTE